MGLEWIRSQHTREGMASARVGRQGGLGETRMDDEGAGSGSVAVGMGLGLGLG